MDCSLVAVLTEWSKSVGTLRLVLSANGHSFATGAMDSACCSRSRPPERFGSLCAVDHDWESDGERQTLHGPRLAKVDVIKRDFLLAVALLLTTATELRSPGSPVGPGEICLVIWITWTVGHSLAQSSLPVTPALFHLFIFWALFGVGQSIGLLSGLSINDTRDWGLFLHDVMAYVLVAAFSCLCVVEAEAELRLHRVAWFMVSLGAVILILQLATAWAWIDLPLIEPWFGDRFRGWSNNPNQLAFLCALQVLLALYLADAATRFASQVMAIACALPAIGIGVLTKTDTFTFALIAACPVFLCVKLRIWLSTPRQVLIARAMAALIAIAAVPMLLASAIPLVASSISDPQNLALGLTKNGGKEAVHEADLRLELWGEAIDRGLEAQMLGLGPGPHLPIPASIIAARQTETDLDTGDHPAVNGTPDFEAHNTFLDLFAQCGLLGVVSFAWIMTTAFFTAVRVRQAGLAALLCGLAVFGLTNMIVRPPIFWFGITLCLVQGNLLNRQKRVAAPT